MQELSLIEVIKNALTALMDSKVFILLMFEFAILLVTLVFSKLMDKKAVKLTGILSSLVVAGFYILNYVDTVVTFVNNVSTKLIELIYFPTTLEFIGVMIISFIIMIVTLSSKKSNKLVKIINSFLPISLSFILLCIIEYINKNNIPFDEFSVFTNPVLTSLYQLGMGLFISWVIGLIIYKVDKFIINRMSLKSEKVNTNNGLITIKMPESTEVIEEDEEIEMPRLKGELVK